MKRFLAALLVLSVVGVGRAGEKDIIAQLKEMGVHVTKTVHITGRTNEQWRWSIDVTFPKTPNTDAALRDLCELPSLESLSLDGSDVTNAGLRTVGGLTGLKSLTLCDTPITDVGLEELVGLKILEYLNLKDCAGVTDAGIDSLSRLKRLLILDLTGTGVTKEGAARLRKALPECEVVFDKT